MPVRRRVAYRRPVDIGRIGLWTFALDLQPSSRSREIVAELEALGYSATWLPEAVGRDPLVASTFYLGATRRMTFATGVVPLYARDPTTLNAAHQTIEEAFPGRFVLGIGVSHAPLVEGLLHTTYGPPLATMRTYLDQMDAAVFSAAKPATPPRRVLAALGPKMLALSAARADGALTYLVTPEHTASAREIIGNKLLAVEQKVVLTGDIDEARRVARAALRIYTTLPNYVNNFKRLGFAADEIESMDDRFVDALVAGGDEDAIRLRVQEHLDAGADHVCLQVLPREGTLPLDEWRRLAPALVG